MDRFAHDAVLTHQDHLQRIRFAHHFYSNSIVFIAKCRSSGISQSNIPSMLYNLATDRD
jgi:hypothetical protein